MKEIFSTSFLSEICKLKEVVTLSLCLIKVNNPYISDDDFMDLRLIFSELLSNAVIHGNENQADKKVYITINMTENRIVSEIMDEGKGFHYAEIVNPQNALGDVFSETGRGLQLVSALTDELTFMGNGNKVKFNKSVCFQMHAEKNVACLNHISNYGTLTGMYAAN